MAIGDQQTALICNPLRHPHFMPVPCWPHIAATGVEQGQTQTAPHGNASSTAGSQAGVVTMQDHSPCMLVCLGRGYFIAKCPLQGDAD